MSTMRCSRWFVVAGALSASTGCAYGEMREVLRTSLASEHNCPEIDVKPRNPKQLRNIRPEFNDQYRVTGCGLQRMYTCPAESGLQEYGAVARCTFTEGDPDSPQTSSMTPDAEESTPDFTE